MILGQDRPLIIIISGTYAVGKTSLAHALASNLNIRQRAGLGIISKTLKYSMPENSIVKGWGDYSFCFSETDLIEKLHRESKLIGRVLESVFEKAYATGEPYIIDGVQLLPEYLPLQKIFYLALRLKNKEEHRSRFLHPKITKKKHLNNANFFIAKTIEKEILKSVQNYQLPIFETNIPEEQLAGMIMRKLNSRPICG